MRPSVEVHDALCRLVEYPREGFPESVEEAAAAVSEACPSAWTSLEPFVAFARKSSLGDLEEVFTRTFDNTDTRALEVGWHAFGENYTRGTFMVTVRGWLRDHGVEESSELPDHLSHMLAVMGRMDAGRAGDLAVDTVGPAMVKVHDELVKLDNPWAGVLGAVLAVLEMHERAPAETNHA